MQTWIKTYRTFHFIDGKKLAQRFAENSLLYPPGTQNVCWGHLASQELNKISLKCFTTSFELLFPHFMDQSLVLSYTDFHSVLTQLWRYILYSVPTKHSYQSDSICNSLDEEIPKQWPECLFFVLFTLLKNNMAYSEHFKVGNNVHIAHFPIGFLNLLLTLWEPL